MAPKRGYKRARADIQSSSDPKNLRSMHSSTVADIAPESAEPQSNTIYFWREYGTEHCYMSQWYKSPFSTDDDQSIVYQHAEQYMMYHKALLFNDSAVADLILEQDDPKEIKALGRKVSNFNEQTWLANRERIVEEASYFKFKNGKALGEDMNGEVREAGVLLKKLLETGERELVEASPRDRIWGVGFAPKTAESRRKSWGLNLLGKALMTARAKLREEEEKSLGKKAVNTDA